MFRHKIRLWLALILLVWVDTALSNCTASDCALRGKTVFAAIDERHNSGYLDFEVQLRMVLTTRKGRVTERQLRIRQLEVPADGDQVLLVFDEPANIRGTALLSYSHLQGADDQWLFLPALKRVKKITSRNKSGAFVGSEFSYEDLTAPELHKYTYLWQREAPCGELSELTCAVVERVALDTFSGYSRELHWIDAEEQRTWRVEYFDKRSGKLSKILTLDDYKTYRPKTSKRPGELWKPHLMTMENVRTGNKTELVWGDYAFARGFTHERDFSVSTLRRAR